MVSHVFDRIADSYDDDWCGLYAESRRRAVNQLAAALSAATDLDVADFAVGTGSTIDSLYRLLSLRNVFGFDVSRGMLDKAFSKLPRQTRLIHDTAAKVENYIEPASLDLVLCHFLLRYMEPSVVMRTALRVLKPGGYFSLITSTQRSLIETHTGRFEKAGRAVGIRRQLAKGGTPLNHAEGIEMLERYGLEIIADTLYRQAVTFHSFDDVRAWALESGWAAEVIGEGLDLRTALTRAAFSIAEVLMQPLYPVDATSEILVVLARKPCRAPLSTGSPSRNA